MFFDPLNHPFAHLVDKHLVELLTDNKYTYKYKAARNIFKRHFAKLESGWEKCGWEKVDNQYKQRIPSKKEKICRTNLLGNVYALEGAARLLELGTSKQEEEKEHPKRGKHHHTAAMVHKHMPQCVAVVCFLFDYGHSHLYSDAVLCSAFVSAMHAFTTRLRVINEQTYKLCGLTLFDHEQLAKIFTRYYMEGAKRCGLSPHELHHKLRSSGLGYRLVS